MSNTTHTPGPWLLNTTTFAGAITHWHVAGKKHGSAYPICAHTIEVEPTGAEQLCNGQLIAAAPELLEALSEMERLATSELWNTGVMKPEFGRALKAARAAIAKATA